MAGPARSQNGAGSPPPSSPTQAVPITFLPEEWLLNMAIENARKWNQPLNFLAMEFEKLAATEEGNPFRGSRKRSIGEDSDLMDQEREMRRQAKVETRKAATDDGGPAAESSSAGAARNRRSSANTIGYDNLPEPTEGSSESLFVSDVKDGEYLPRPLPTWYTKIKTTDRGMKQLGKHPLSHQTQALTALQSMKGCMGRCEKDHVPPAQLAKFFEELRDQVHKAEILLKVDKFLVRKAKMLEEATGLPRIFASKKVNYPWDLKADAFQLYNRWREGIFEIDLLRGITVRKGKDRAADSIDPSWKGRFSAKFYGEGHLVLGQWWPTQLTSVRDGAHGSAQGGIFGEKEKGAYSVVLSGAGQSQYDDQDDGNDIWYSGTDGMDFTPTENTLRLIESCDVLHNQVRVLRSHQLPKNNPYRPVVGLRYDGLYDVVEKKLVNKEKQSYKFRLVRSKGQFPIRCEKNAARRPTRFEIDEENRLRKRIN